MEEFEWMPGTAQKKISKALSKLAAMPCVTQKEQEKYDESRKAIDDYYSGLYGAYITGLQDGEAKSKQNTILAIAKKMLLSGMSEDQVMEFIGLSKEQLAPLKS